MHHSMVQICGTKMNSNLYIDPYMKEQLVKLYTTLRHKMPDAKRDVLLEMARRMLHAQLLWDWQVFKLNMGLDKDSNIC